MLGSTWIRNPVQSDLRRISLNDCTQFYAGVLAGLTMYIWNIEKAKEKAKAKAKKVQAA